MQDKRESDTPLSEVELGINYALVITTNAWIMALSNWRYYKVYQFVSYRIQLRDEPNIISMYSVKN